MLIAQRGAAIGALGPEGRAVDRPRGAGYAVETWLARDGDAAGQAAAARRPGLARASGAATAELANGWRVTLLHGAAPPARLEEACARRTVLVAWQADPGGPDGPCLLLGSDELQRLGAVSIRPRGEGVAVVGALEISRRRWARAGDGGQDADVTAPAAPSAPVSADAQ